jgi:hypothetical protein
LVDVQLVFPQSVPAREKIRATAETRAASRHDEHATPRHTSVWRHWHSHWVPLRHHLRPVVYLRAYAGAHAQLALHGGVGEARLAGVDGAEIKDKAV